MQAATRALYVLAELNDILDAAGFGIAAQFCEVEHMVDRFDERGSTCLDRLEERCLAVIEGGLRQEFRRCQNLCMQKLV